MEWASPMNEYEKLVIRMNTPRVVIDNAVCATATLVKVDSARKHGILLEAVQVLTDLNLSINKAYISCDGRWFMDVFHVTDQNGEKLTDESVISYIEKSLGSNTTDAARSNSFKGLTALELTGTDRPGLLSEVFAVLTDMDCNIVEAKVWTHNRRIASLIYVKDEDSHKIESIGRRLRSVLKGHNDIRSAKTAVSVPVTHTERRLHQMMFADRDYERKSANLTSVSPSSPTVSVQNWSEREYSVVNIQCMDRPKLLFDIVCTLTDMEYVVFHATVDTKSERAHQEFYIRHTDGSPISSEAEMQRVIQCLQAAIERRTSEGVRLELSALDRRGLLSDVTRTFRENGLSVTRAEVSTSGETVTNVFYVTDVAGNPVDSKTIEGVRKRIGVTSLKVQEPSIYPKSSSEREETSFFSIGSLVKRNLYNLGLIRSCS